MNQTKETITQKTHKANLPDVSPAGKKVMYIDSSGNMGIGIGVGTNTPFNGERPIVAPIPGLHGKILHGATNGEVLDNLLKALYPTQPPTCSLTASNPEREYGAARDVSLTWTVTVGDNLIDAITVNNIAQDPDVLSSAQNTTTLPNATTTFTMSVVDNTSPPLTGTASASVQYFHNRYWFQSSTNFLTASDATISSVLQGTGSKEFSTSRQQGRSFTLASEYVYFAYPASFGSASFMVGGLPNTAYQLKQFQYTNINGYVETFNLYRSGNAGTGSIQVTLN